MQLRIVGAAFWVLVLLFGCAAETRPADTDGGGSLGVGQEMEQGASDVCPASAGEAVRRLNSEDEEAAYEALFTCPRLYPDDSAVQAATTQLIQRLEGDGAMFPAQLAESLSCFGGTYPRTLLSLFQATSIDENRIVFLGALLKSQNASQYVNEVRTVLRQEQEPGRVALLLFALAELGQATEQEKTSLLDELRRGTPVGKQVIAQASLNGFGEWLRPFSVLDHYLSGEFGDGVQCITAMAVAVSAQATTEQARLIGELRRESGKSGRDVDEAFYEYALQRMERPERADWSGFARRVAAVDPTRGFYYMLDLALVGMRRSDLEQVRRLAKSGSGETRAGAARILCAHKGTEASDENKKQ